MANGGTKKHTLHLKQGLHFFLTHHKKGLQKIAFSANTVLRLLMWLGMTRGRKKKKELL